MPWAEYPDEGRFGVGNLRPKPTEGHFTEAKENGLKRTRMNKEQQRL